MRKLIESYNNGYGPGNGGNGNGAPGSGNNGGNGNNSNGGNGNGSPKRPSILMLILSGLMTVIVVLMLYNAFFGTNTGTAADPQSRFRPNRERSPDRAHRIK